MPKVIDEVPYTKDALEIYIRLMEKELKPMDTKVRHMKACLKEANRKYENILKVQR